MAASERFKEWFDLMDQMIGVIATTTPGTKFTREGKIITDRWTVLMGDMDTFFENTTAPKNRSILDELNQFQADVNAFCISMGA